MKMIDIDTYEAQQMWEEWHDIYSITLGELLADGVYDFSQPDWDFDSYDDEQRNRFWAKFAARYRYREIGVLPPAAWKHETLRKLNEIMPKYKMLYKAIADGMNVLQDGDEYHKRRAVHSDYPQTMIGGNQDYASDANDLEYETIRYGNMLDAVQKLRGYDDVDVMILNEMETLFSCLFTINLNAL